MVKAAVSTIFIIINCPVLRGEVVEAAMILKPNINIPGISEAYSQQLSHTQSSVFTFGLKGQQAYSACTMLCQVVFLMCHCCCTMKDAVWIPICSCLER